LSSQVARRAKTIVGWRSSHRQTDAGAVESQQRATLEVPVVDFSEEGARDLGERYWAQVERSTLGLVRAQYRGESLELRIVGGRPLLLRFAPPQLEVTATLVRCTYPIVGGLLARRPDGEIGFEQSRGGPAELTSTIRGFFPRLAARQGRPDWSGALYNLVQSRVHVAISRRYFASLIEGPQ
jgi:hypothetical protein